MTSTNHVNLSVVIPVYNEEENIPELYRRLNDVLHKLGKTFEIIFVDDGSEDRSYDMLRSLHEDDEAVKLVRFSRNFGHQVAITAGIDYASGDAIVIMDADLQDPPEIIPKLIEKWEDNYDVIYAVRESREGEGRFKRMTASLFYRILKRLANIDVPMDAGDYRLISRKVASSLKSLREKHRYVRGLTSWVGFHQTGVSYKRPERHAGEAKYTIRRMLNFALDGITSFSFVPLQIATVLGFVVAVCCIVYGLYVVYLALFSDSTVRGWALAMVAILFLGSVQLIAIGIIGEYLGRIYDEVKQRPLYVVSETIGFD
jgi:dolichol-phosphate mannosyltransferase